MAKMKLRLNLDHLSVDSFATHPAQDGVRGTVEGRALDLPRTSTFDLEKYTNLCTVGCPGGTLVCNDPVDPSDSYRLPELEGY
jgi:hypothetical protein